MSIKLTPKVVAIVIKAGEYPYNFLASEEAIPKNAPVAKSETTGGVLQAQATDSTRMPCIGIAYQATIIGETVKVMSVGVVTNVPRTEDFMYGDMIYISATKGKLTKTPPELADAFVQSVGNALNSSDMVIVIDSTMIEYKE